MRTATFFLLPVLLLCTFPSADAAPDSPERVRIGVDIRLSYKACIEYWTPITEHLSKAVPSHRFTIVPIASHQDLVRVLETNGVDFVALDPAMELMAEDRFGVAPLATMVESWSPDAEPPAANAASSGAIICRADRKDLRTLKDLRGHSLYAVKPWSLTGWIAEWRLLVDHGVDPQKSVEQVSFVGGTGDVIKGVLNRHADAGVVDAGVLFGFGINGRIPNGSLAFFNSQGEAVPFVPGKFAQSTNVYPGRFFSKAASTSDDLAKRVADALMRQPLTTTLDGMPSTIRWMTPSNTNKVRRVLTSLMGTAFAESPGYPIPHEYPAWVYHAWLAGFVAIATLLVLALMHSRYMRRKLLLEEQLQTVRRELIEARADRERINAILTLAGCGIDIIDEHNQIVYADAGLERKYGDWRGKKCHGYYCQSDTPCPDCKMPTPADEHGHVIVDLNDSSISQIDDPHARVHYSEGEASRMIGIPFRDEGGRWLYARVHLPLDLPSADTKAVPADTLVSLAASAGYATVAG